MYELTSPLTEGAGVKSLQTLLIKRGYLKDAADGAFGVLTAQACYRAKFWLGYPNPDKTGDDRLRSYLDGSKKPGPIMLALQAKRRLAQPATPLRVKVYNEATKYIGVKESPPNTNQVLFSKWYGITGPWCAMFYSYCSDRVGGKFHYAYVPYIVSDARAGRNGLTVTTNPLQGDAVCFDWPGESPGLADHVGIFDRWIVKGKTFSTIEGNTAVGNNSNGGEVMRRERNVSDVQAFVHSSK